MRGEVMIYLLQPILYKNIIYDIIKKNLLKHFTLKKITVHQLHIINNKNNNTYFIIHDKHLKSWDGFNISKTIRQKDHNAHIILITNDLDYPKYYRSHIRFLSIIDLDSNQKEHEIQEILQYLI